MVKAILEGRKTQTRRVIKPQPEGADYWTPYDDTNDSHRLSFCPNRIEGIPSYIVCPYGQLGDWLYVREAFAKDIPGCPNGIAYKANHLDPRGDGPANPIRWRPATCMPRWASRLSLEIVGVRVERVQDISHEDVCREGGPFGNSATSNEDFSILWDSINAKRGYSWASNPWVWVMEFKVVEGRKT